MSSGSALPKYIQISEMLIRDIAAGRLVDGARLAPERDMAKALGISVGTLRKSLADLEQKGALKRVQGSGNYIQANTQASSIYSFFRVELVEGGGLPTAHVVSLDTAPKPSEWINSTVAPDAHRIRRLRYLNGVPAVLEEIMLDRGVCPQLSTDDLSEALYVMYRRKLNLWITSAEDRLTQRPVPDWAPDGFGVARGDTTICVLRTSLDQTNRPVEFSYSWINTNVAQYVARIK
jgi:GntR family transcriptional regulator